MKNKQTAVDWLDRWFRDNPEATHEEGNKALKQAKQIEKEQIKEAYDAGYNSGCSYMYDGKKQFKNKDQYYKETYGDDT